MELTPFRVFALLTRNLPNLLAIRFPVLAASCRVTISACGPRCLLPGSMNSRPSAVVLGCAKVLIGGTRVLTRCSAVGSLPVVLMPRLLIRIKVLVASDRDRLSGHIV